MNFSEYEKKILSLVYREGPLSKKEMTQKGKMSWGTAVKAVNALVERKYLIRSGTVNRKSGAGKNAYVFDLSASNPLAIGIDSNHDRTSLILTNLREGILITQYHQSPVLTDFTTLKRFFSRIIANFLDTYVSDKTVLYGIGIGIPGLSFKWLAKNTPQEQLGTLTTFLEEKFTLPVRFEVNHRAYAMHEKWDNAVFSHENFQFITVRNGVGLAIMINGQLLTGSQGFAGEIAHFKVAPKHLRCRCGSQGCLETVINQNVLFRRYIEEVKGETSPETYTQDRVFQELPELFREAKSNNPAALKIVNDMAEYLGKSLAHAILLLNIPNLIVCGYFGEDGDVLIPQLEKEIHQHVQPLTDFSVTYRPLQQVGFTRGAALLVLKDFIG